MKKASFFFALLLAISSSARAASTMTYDLTATGTSWSTPYAPSDASLGVTNAIAAATTWLGQNAGGTAIISFGSGSYEFVCPANPSNSQKAIDVSNINPGTDGNGVTGRLIIEGQGDTGSNATHLGFTQNVVASDLTTTKGTTTITSELEIGGTDCSHITFTQLHLYRIVTANDGSNRMITQGTVQSVGANDITIDLPLGYPTPPVLWLYDPGHAGHYIRAYQYVNGVPQLNTSISQQNWTSATNVGNTVSPADPYLWEFDGLPSNPPFTPGQIVGIKAVHGGGCGKFIQVTDIVLDHIRWTDEAHLQFEDGSQPSDYITVSNCQTDRGDDIEGLTPCLATDGGGLQFHVTGSHINAIGNTSIGEGDDAIAYFSTPGGVVSGNTLSDDFARGINLNSCPDVDDNHNPEILTAGNAIIRSNVLPVNLPEDGLGIDSPTLPPWALLALGVLLLIFAGARKTACL